MHHVWNFPSQFRPVVPAQQGQHFVPVASQQFRPVGQVPSSNVGMPVVHDHQMQFSQPMQQFPPRPNQPGLSTLPAQPIQGPYGQTNRPLTSEPTQSHQTAPPWNNHMTGLGAPGMPPSSSYNVRHHANVSIFPIVSLALRNVSHFL